MSLASILLRLGSRRFLRAKWNPFALIAKQGFRAQVFSAARGTKNDIDAVLKSGASGVAMIIPTSDLHIEVNCAKPASKS